MRSIIRWGVDRPVVANILMLFLLIVGGYSAYTMKREIFPEFSLDMIQVSVVYKGASVEEIEESVCAKIEEEITGIEGVEEITSRAVEGMGVVTVELEADTDKNRALNDVKNMVDQIDTFPQESERPLTVQVIRKVPVIKVAVYGEVSELVLTSLAEEVQSDLLAIDGISQVALFGNREYEVAIEIPESNLRKYGLTLTQVAELVRSNSIDLPGGTLRAESGQILLRTKGRRYRAKEFEDLVVVSKLDGTTVPLSRIANITDTFEEVDIQARMDGKPAVLVSVDKTSKQDAVEIADKVREYVKTKNAELPESVRLSVWDDSSVFIKSRLDLMIRNGMQGLALVFIILALFLKLRPAFWVAMGIPISILGAFVFLDWYGYTLNMISMYAFIVVLGIVVDDAIVVGDNIYTKLEEGLEPVEAANEGALEIAYPVINAVATTIVAFAPMLFVAGTMGKFMRVFPVAIIAVLLVSLMEAFVILPAHLAHMKRRENTDAWWSPFVLAESVRSRVHSGMDYFVEVVFLPFMSTAMKHRYVFIAAVTALLMVSFGMFAGGRVGFVFFPKVDSDRISAELVMPQGTSITTTQAAVKRIEEAANKMAEQYPLEGGRPIVTHMFSLIGDQVIPGSQSQERGSHLGNVVIELASSEYRDTPSSKLAKTWRELTGDIPGAISLTFSSTGGGPRPGGPPIEVILVGNDMEELRKAAAAVRLELARFEGVEDIQDTYRPGKPELRFSLREGARQLGITLSDLARQVRANFWGEEALKIQRGRNEVTIRVRYPERERVSRGDVERMKIRTSDNKEIPFGQVAEVEEYQGPASIHRMYSRRAITVTADVEEQKANAREVMQKLNRDFLPNMRAEFPGVSVLAEGAEKDRRESLQSLFKGLIVALFLIYVLLVNMFRTYTQPFIVMVAIPFSFIGIVAGHLLFGMDFTILSLFGVLALAGIVVNDSILFSEAANRFTDRGQSLHEALISAARNRFRQILLTTLSTAGGLAPILAETSFQAQFLKPMTVTVVFGLMAATLLILLFVPALTLVRADILELFGIAVPGRDRPGPT